MAMKESTKTVIKYLQANNTQNMTADDVAAALGLETRQVNGVFTRCISTKDMGERVEAEVELPDGTHKKVKFLKLNDAGMALDVDAPTE